MRFVVPNYDKQGNNLHGYSGDPSARALGQPGYHQRIFEWRELGQLQHAVHPPGHLRRGEAEESQQEERFKEKEWKEVGRGVRLRRQSVLDTKRNVAGQELRSVIQLRRIDRAETGGQLKEFFTLNKTLEMR